MKSEPPVLGGGHLSCPRCDWSKRRRGRTLGRYRRHYVRRHAEKARAHPSVISWLSR
jgi:hypothetical protein